MHRRLSAACWRLIKPEFVKINRAKLPEAANQLAARDLRAPDWKIPGALPESNTAFPSHIFYICAIDFCFTHLGGNHHKYTIGGDITGSAAASACFYRRFGEAPVDAKELLNVTASLKRIRGFFQARRGIPLLGERRRNLQETARIVLEKFGNDPVNILIAAGYDAGRVAKTLRREFPLTFGSDQRLVESPSGRYLTIEFNKRAQLWPLIYQGRALNSDGELPLLGNIEKIGPIVDCAVPNALRKLGILEYSADLESKINQGIELPSDGKEELEIRLGTKYAVELLLQEMQATTRITIIELDFCLWTAGKKSGLKHHLTKTTDY